MPQLIDVSRVAISGPSLQISVPKRVAENYNWIRGRFELSIHKGTTSQERWAIYGVSRNIYYSKT